MRLDELGIRVDGLFQLWGSNRLRVGGRDNGSRILLGVQESVGPGCQSESQGEAEKDIRELGTILFLALEALR
jgi:hypothetical protein